MREIYRRLIEFTQDGVYRYTFDDGQILFCNPGLLRILDLEGEPDDYIGRHLRELLVYTEKEGTVRQALQETGEVLGFEYHFRTLSGEDRWVLHDSFVLRDHESGGPVVDAIVKDISARKRAEIALAAERERLAVTLRSIGDGVITTDRGGRVTLVNRVAEALTGWPQDEALGRPLVEVFSIVNEKTRRPIPDPVEKVLRSGRVVGLANHTLLVARDGTERVIADSGAPIRDAESRIIGVVLVFRDETERRRMEDELLNAQKLESVGVLAGGIAHDFNNILTAISGNIALARVEPDDGERVEGRLRDAERAVARARDLTQQLLTFAKGGAPVRRTASFADVIRDSARFAVTGSNVRCELDVAADLWLGDIDPGQVSQVLSNIILNAEQAMPGGGTVRVKAENVVLPDQRPAGVVAGHYVRITISDDGVGIPRKHLKRIFEPYFTTKPTGSGLGLAISYSIVKRHGGYLLVESRLGLGTTFTLLMPAADDQVLAATPTPKPAPAPSRGRVLMMDDDEMVREAGRAVLSHLGYEVELATDGEEALDAYRMARELGLPFDVVILDLTVPGGMGGLETVRRLRVLDPSVRAVVSSGYSNDPVLADHASHGFKGVICKPYFPDDLSRVLRNVMAAAGESPASPS